MCFFLYQFTILCFVFMYRVTTSLSGHHSNCSYSKPQAVVKSSGPRSEGWRHPGLTHITQLNRPVGLNLQPPAQTLPERVSFVTLYLGVCSPKICAPCSYCNYIPKTEIGFTSCGRVWERYHVFIAKSTS